MIELRWIVRDGEKVLQYRTGYMWEGVRPQTGWTDWQDVPVVNLEAWA